MEEKNEQQNEIFSKALRAGRRTYFFDVRSTRGGDYYLTIAESKKYYQNEDGSSNSVEERQGDDNFSYKKHKIFLYKEDFKQFKELFEEVTDFIVKEKGEEVISEKHQKDFKKNFEGGERDKYSDISFEDL